MRERHKPEADIYSFEAVAEEIDSLKTRVKRVDKPWFQKGSVLVSILALVFSFGTTIVSYYNSHLQEQHASHVELRGLIQKILTVPTELTEARVRFKDDTAVYSSVSSYKNAELMMLTKQAAYIALHIPSIITTSEVLPLADSFTRNGEYRSAQEMIQLGQQVATSTYDYIDVSTVEADYFFTQALFEEGRKSYSGAVSRLESAIASGKVDVGYGEYRLAIIELYWAEWESTFSFCDNANTHINNAKKIADRSHPSTQAFIQNEISRIRAKGC